MVGVAEVLRLLTDPGDAVVINPPVYPPFTAFLEHAGRHVVHAPARPGRPARPRGARPRVRPAPARTAAAPRTCCATRTTRRARCTPPTSCAAVGELAARHGVRVVADEIHAPLVPAPARVRPDHDARSPTRSPLHSASKAFNLAGLRAAVAVPGPGGGRRPGPAAASRSATASCTSARSRRRAAYREGGAVARRGARRARAQPAAARSGCSPTRCPTPSGRRPRRRTSPGSTCAQRRPRGTTRPRACCAADASRSTPGPTFGVEGAGHRAAQPRGVVGDPDRRGGTPAREHFSADRPG